MFLIENVFQLIVGVFLLLASLGVVLAKKPVHSALFFLLSLLLLAAFYLELDASFIAALQILVYAGAILVIFMFVIILFQDAHVNIDQFQSQASNFLLFIAAASFLATLIFLTREFRGMFLAQERGPWDYGTVEALGMLLYVDFFFPFEAVILLFLIAVVGAVYMAKKEVE